MSDINSFKKYDHPYVTVDVIALTVIEDSLRVFLVKRDAEPFKDKWSLPGGFVRIDESLEDAANRKLKEEVGIEDIYLEQLFTFGDVARDTRARVITVAYFGLVPPQKLNDISTSHSIESAWISVTDLPELAFDHERIITTTVERVCSKLEYSTIAYALLPKQFRLSELQKVYEVILGRSIDKRNFRKKMLSLGLIEATGERYEGRAHRPASLYRFKDERIHFFD